MNYERIKLLKHQIRRTLSLVSEKENVNNTELTKKANKIKELLDTPVKRIEKEAKHD